MKVNKKNMTHPSLAEQKKKFLSTHPGTSLIIIAEKPSPLLLDDDEEDYTPLNSKMSALDVASLIKDSGADIAIPVSVHDEPYDWDALKDALVGEKLRKMGLKVLAPSLMFSALTFDKYELHRALEGVVRMPRAFSFDRSLILSDSGETDVLNNVYREYILSLLERARYPLVIKDRIGVSSYHIEVAKSYGEAKTYLLSKRCKTSKIIEEYATGEQFALEAYCNGRECLFGPLIALSLNQYGITSPRFNEKKTFHHENISSLFNLVRQVIKKFFLSGIIQFDLVYSKGEWVVLEINPRAGGVTLLSAAALNLDLYSLYTSPLFSNSVPKTFIDVIEKKVALNSPLDPTALYTYQTENLSARQLREKGYRSVIKRLTMP